MSNPTYANQGAVSAIADDALVMAVGSDGRYKPVSFANLMSAIKGGIQIGGRNLLKGTAEPTTLDGSGPVLKVYNFAEPLNLSKIAGKLFTISFDYEYSNVATGSTFTQSRFVVSLAFTTASGTTYKEASAYLSQSSSGLSGKGRKVYTFEMPEGSSSSITKASAYIQALSGNATMSNIKIEEGNIATAWSPAYEDLRGGVIVSISTTYDYTQKGGAHEYACFAHRDSEIGADGFLAFESLGALCEYIGRASEDNECHPKLSLSCLRGCEHRHSRVDENNHKHSQSSSEWQWLVYTDPTMGFNGGYPNLLLLGGSSDIYSEAKLEYGQHFLDRLEETCLRGCVAIGKEVAL